MLLPEQNKFTTHFFFCRFSRENIKEWYNNLNLWNFNLILFTQLQDGFSSVDDQIYKKKFTSSDKWWRLFVMTSVD